MYKFQCINCIAIEEIDQKYFEHQLMNWCFIVLYKLEESRVSV